MRNEPMAVARMVATAPRDCAVSAITAYELFAEVAKCSNPIRESAKVEKLLKAVQVLPFETAAAKNAGEIRADLESRDRGSALMIYSWLVMQSQVGSYW
jgi:predicted nucleic acid-binding protein